MLLYNCSLYYHICWNTIATRPDNKIWLLTIANHVLAENTSFHA